jgi:hypothetical protein
MSDDRKILRRDVPQWRPKVEMTTIKLSKDEIEIHALRLVDIAVDHSTLWEVWDRAREIISDREDAANLARYEPDDVCPF